MLGTNPGELDGLLQTISSVFVNHSELKYRSNRYLMLLKIYWVILNLRYLFNVPNCIAFKSKYHSQVRSAILLNFPQICKIMKEEIVVTRVLPILSRLVTDSSEHVRISFAEVINNLSTIVRKERTIQVLLPLILTLLRDEVSEVFNNNILFYFTSLECGCVNSLFVLGSTSYNSDTEFNS